MGNQNLGLVFDIKKFAIHDGPGIRTTIFLQGCPLKCWWCHNPESQFLKPPKYPNDSYNRELNGKEMTVQAVIDEIIKDKIFYDESGGGVTFSGGEPFMQSEFLAALLKESKNHGLYTAVDTSGFASWEIIQSLLPYIDLFLYDLKLIDPEIHRKYTGVDNQLILTNLSQLIENQQNINIRIPIIPSITDTEKNLTSIISLLQKIGFQGPINILPYNELGVRKYELLGGKYQLTHLKPPTSERMQEIREFFLKSFPNCSIGG